MSANLQQRGRPGSFGTEQPQETASTMSQTGFGLPRFEVIDFFAGYAASGLTQPTGTIWVTDAGIKPWQSLIKPTKNKTFSNKLGWDERSVPNMLEEDFFW